MKSFQEDFILFNIGTLLPLLFSLIVLCQGSPTQRDYKYHENEIDPQEEKDIINLKYCNEEQYTCINNVHVSCNDGVWQNTKHCSDNGRICIQGKGCVNFDYFETNPKNKHPYKLNYKKENVYCDEAGERLCDGETTLICNGIYWLPGINCAEYGMYCIEGYCTDTTPTKSSTQISTEESTTYTHSDTTNYMRTSDSTSKQPTTYESTKGTEEPTTFIQSDSTPSPTGFETSSDTGITSTYRSTVYETTEEPTSYSHSDTTSYMRTSDSTSKQPTTYESTKGTEEPTTFIQSDSTPSPTGFETSSDTGITSTYRSTVYETTEEPTSYTH